MIVDTLLAIYGETGISSNERDKTINDNQLIADARTDPAAFARLYRRHYDEVFRYCVHRLFERHAAEDVTSAVFLKAVENIGTFDGSEEQFRNWLYRIASNAVNNHLRRFARQQQLLKKHGRCLAVEECDEPEGPDDASEKMELLRKAMFTLKPKYQTIITLRFFEKLKLTEIAEVLKANPQTVRSQLSRALAKLRKKITSLQQGV